MGWTRTAYGDVYVVSDGMGGHRGGALAAELTVRTLQEQLARIAPDSVHFSDGVRQAFLAANHEVNSHRNPSDPKTREMGATGVALVTSGSRFIVAHVGDSRAYLWRAASGLRQLTRDHTRVQSMVDSGLLTTEQAAVHPDASILDRAIGHQATVQADVSDWMSLEPGDLLLLCSDGLCGYVSDEEIADVLRSGDEPQRATDRLIECALGKGGQDNVTVQLVGYAVASRGRWGWLLKGSIGPLPASLVASALTASVVGLSAYVWYDAKLADVRPASSAPPAHSALATEGPPNPQAHASAASAHAASAPRDSASSAAAAAPPAASSGSAISQNAVRAVQGKPIKKNPTAKEPVVQGKTPATGAKKGTNASGPTKTMASQAGGQGTGSPASAASAASTEPAGPPEAAPTGEKTPAAPAAPPDASSAPAKAPAPAARTGGDLPTHAFYMFGVDSLGLARDYQIEFRRASIHIEVFSSETFLHRFSGHE